MLSNSIKTPSEMFTFSSSLSMGADPIEHSTRNSLNEKRDNGDDNPEQHDAINSPTRRLHGT